VPRGRTCHTTKQDDLNVRYSVSSCLFSAERKTIACHPPLSTVSLVSPNNEYDTTWLLDEMCASNGCCVERNAARSASPGREDGAKTSFVRLFRGKVFRDESTRFARTNGRMNAARSWILDYILVRRCSWKLPYNRERFHCIVESAALRIGMQIRCVHKQTVLVEKSSYCFLVEKYCLNKSCNRRKQYKLTYRSR